MHDITRSIRPLCLVVLGAAAACGPVAPENPTWAADVAPILAANCVRCHSVPPLGGAPGYGPNGSSPVAFRLDSYDDWIADDGTRVLGAAAVIDLALIRIKDEVNPMPPRFGLADDQIETLENWAALPRDNQNRPPRGVPRPGNRAPTFVELERQASDDALVIRYEIRDADLDIVLGELRAEEPGLSVNQLVTTGLHSGRGEVVWDLGQSPAGTYTLTATLDDGSEEFPIELGELTVPPGGAP